MLVYEFKETLKEDIVEARLNRFIVKTKKWKNLSPSRPWKVKGINLPGK
jgi:hypothetical protein